MYYAEIQDFIYFAQVSLQWVYTKIFILLKNHQDVSQRNFESCGYSH